MNINRTIIIPASLTPLARALAAGLAPGGVGMFETPLYTGATLTHYVSSGWIGAAWDGVLHDANALYAACQATIPPQTVTLAQCQQLVSQSVVADCDLESAEATFARVGLHL